MSRKKYFGVVYIAPFALTLIAVLLFSSCSKEEEKRPEKVLSESEMVDVMVDVHLAEAVLTRKRGENQKVDRLTDAYYKKIYEKHDISKKTFDTSFSYYQQNLSDLQRIYEQVITELNKMQRKREMERKKKSEDTTDDKEIRPDSNVQTRELDMKLKDNR
ncbi:MAG: DUF4296 domain-containing protein [Bacteroidota bacterium]